MYLFGCCPPNTDSTPPLSPGLILTSGQQKSRIYCFWRHKSTCSCPIHRAPELLQSTESHASSAHKPHNQQAKPVCWLVLLNKCSCSFDSLGWKEPHPEQEEVPTAHQALAGSTPRATEDSRLPDFLREGLVIERLEGEALVFMEVNKPQDPPYSTQMPGN